MSSDVSFSIENLENSDLIRLIGIFMGHVTIHYGLWFAEASRTIGLHKAMQCEDKVVQPHAGAALKRLGFHLGNCLDRDIGSVLSDKSRGELLIFLREIAKTWVAGDGLWFQAVEETEGMACAKTVNDLCWASFARLESFKILRFLGITGQGGLDTLEKALRLRIYSSINSYSSEWDATGSLLFRMTECRVQEARRRKGLADYPCKSAGVTEYSEFALGINPEIITECIICPPDEVPEGLFCMWKFSFRKSQD